ncbi:MAG TPA: M56 family metallopeptidase [Candidatus Sulfotelmatobacter sp.]
MISKTFSSFWSALAPALGDHLWQSTVVALVAALLTLAFRKNHARSRYWLWLAASLKFLVPFSWFVALGNHLAWRNPAASASTALYYTVEEISRPFTQSATVPVKLAAPSAGLTPLLASALIAIWLSGFLAVLCWWCLRWRRIYREVQKAVRRTEGREFQALRRMEGEAGITTPLELRRSRSTLEPGIFGVRRPVLLWPEGISERLDDAQLQAVIAHELCHVRRRDNLAAVSHMMVEAIFWFYPLVWWLGARLIDERERACDEDVIGSGSERQTYAESILKVCEFCVGSPLPCVAGVTGADLKKRMVHIMSEHVVRKLDFTRRLLLSAVAVAVIASPIAFGLLHATPSRAQDDSTVSNTRFVESATIKPSELNTPTYAGTETHMIRMMYGPGKFDARNVTLRAIMQEAYQVQSNQIEGPSDPLDKSAFDVQMKLAKPETDRLPSKEDMQQLRQGLQKLLAERAGLVLHTETKTLPIYALEVAENGPKLQRVPASESDDMKGSGPVRMGGQMRMKMDGNEVYGIAAQGISSDELAQQLSRQVGMPVLNKTGLQGRYDFSLNWNDAKGNSTEAEPGSGNPSASSLFTAVQEQLGLKLEPLKAPTQVLVVDHVEKPEGN